MIKSAMILMLSVAPLLAQTERKAALGDRVRISAPKAGYRSLTGEVTATTPDALQLRLDGGTEVAVMRSQIDQLLLSLSTRRNTARGAAIGGMLAGGLTFLYGPKRISESQPMGTGKVPAVNIITATIGGAAIGALVGHYTRSDRWVAVSPRQ